MTGRIMDSRGTELLCLEEDVIYCLGREKGESGSGILIDDIFVSRKHAEIGCDNGYYIRDRKSKNGTYLNSKRIEPGEKVFLTDGDIFRLADREYHFSCSGESGGESGEGEGEPGACNSKERFGPCPEWAETDAEKIGEKSGYESERDRPGSVMDDRNHQPGRNEKKTEKTENEEADEDYPELKSEGDSALAAVSKLAEAEASEEGEGEEEKESGAWGPFVYSLRASAAGRRLSVETGQKGCIEYQVRMIEENPGLQICEVRHVRNIENDCFLCDIGGLFALKDYLIKDKKGIDGIELVDRILKLVKIGEEHMLDRDRYFLTPSTIFMDRDGNLMLIYIPHMDKKDRCFSKGMEELCALLADLYVDQEAGLNAMAKLFGEDTCDTREYIKNIYHYKLIDLPGHGKKEEHKIRKIPFKYILTGLSFLCFMAVFWFGNLNYINLSGIFLILVGGNVLLYNNRKEGDINVNRKVHD